MFTISTENLRESHKSANTTQINPTKQKAQSRNVDSPQFRYSPL